MHRIKIKSIPNKEWKKIIDSVHHYRYHDFKSWIFWLGFSGFIIGLAGYTLAILNVTLPNNRDTSLFDVMWARLWFGIFHFFTNQTNLLMIIYYFLFFFFFKTWIFKKKNFTIVVCLYANLVMLSYWLVMFPQWISGNMFDKSIYGIIYTTLFHLVTPVIFDLFVFFGANYPLKKIKNPLNRIYTRNFMWIPLIYIVIYSIYAVSINFVSLPSDIFRDDIVAKKILEPNHYYISVYGALTNFNSLCYNPKYLPDGEILFDESSHGSLVNTLNGFAILFLYVTILYSITKLNNFLVTPKAMIEEINKSNEQYIKKQQWILGKYSLELEKDYYEKTKNDRTKQK